MSELNPNHPTTQAISDHWHKIAAILLHKLGHTDVCITPADLEAMDQNTCIVIQELDDGLHVRLVDMAEGQRLAREQGGLPT